MKSSGKITVSRQCTFEALESRQLMAVGGLDPSFGVGGKFTLPFGLTDKVPHTLRAEDVAVQADGKTIVAGLFRRTDSLEPEDFAVVRLNFDGTLDTTFGQAEHRGIFIAHLGKDGGDNRVSSVAIQPDGKILVAGAARVSKRFGDDPLKMALVRLLPNGQLDNSFDGDGKRIIDIDNAEVNDMTLQQNGKIVLAGTKFGGLIFNTDSEFLVVRLNADGSADKSFNGDGSREIGFGGDDVANGVAIDEFGRIVVVGQTGPFEKERIALARLKSDGTKDTTFSSGGTLTTDIARFSNSKAQDVLVQAGRIVVLSEVDVNPDPNFTNHQFALLRYTATGNLDASFGDSGQGFIETGLGGNDQPAEILQAPRGGIIAAGSSSGKFALVSYTQDGKLETAFGNGGSVTTDFGADGKAFAAGVAYGPGNRIVVAGSDALKTARYLDFNTNVVSIRPVDGQAIEGPADGGNVIVSRSEVLPVATRVFLNLGGNAVSGLDYTTPNLGKVLHVPTQIIQIGTGKTIPTAPPPGDAFIDIPAGTRDVIVSLSAREDALLEGNEVASFSIAPNSAYTLGQTTRADVNIADSTTVKVNFQAPSQVLASGYVADLGLPFQDQGGGLSYGWDADNRGNMRIRNNPGSPDFRFDSLALMQKDGANRKWEIALPNGLYEVHLVAGDPSFTDSVYKMNLENRFALSGIPSGNTRWFERALNIQVNDGRLTLANTTGSSNNKIAFIDIKAAAPGAVEGPITGNLPVDLVAPAPVKPAAVIVSRVFSQVQI
jgi:uncharacterized delta-60 repeat protein